MAKELPSIDAWLKEVKTEKPASGIGMFLIHNGVVRETAKAAVREGRQDMPEVSGMEFSYDQEAVDQCIRETLDMRGISCVRVWLNEGRLNVGDSIMLVLVGGDIRPHVVDALQFLVGKIKNECVIEKELF